MFGYFLLCCSRYIGSFLCVFLKYNLLSKQGNLPLVKVSVFEITCKVGEKYENIYS